MKNLCLYSHLSSCLRAVTSSAAADEAQVVESGHPVLDGGRGVAELGRVVLVVSCHHRHQRAIGDVAQSHHLARRQDKLWVLDVLPACVAISGPFGVQSELSSI